MTSQVTGAGEELNRKKLFMKMKFHVESFSSLLNKKKKKKEKKQKPPKHCYLLAFRGVHFKVSYVTKLQKDLMW